MFRYFYGLVTCAEKLSLQRVAMLKTTLVQIMALMNLELFQHNVRCSLFRKWRQEKWTAGKSVQLFATLHTASVRNYIHGIIF